MIPEAAGMIKRAITVHAKGFNQYDGNPKKICTQIIDDCWNGEFFQASAGHFHQFWMRDFGMNVKSLIKLGYKKQVQKTLSFALKKYKKNNKVTTTIRKNKAFDFPTYAPDSLAFLLYSLRCAKYKLTKDDKAFLNEQIEEFRTKVVDPFTGLVKQGHFSSMKDHYIRNSSCYDNIMLAVVAKEAKTLKLECSFTFQKEHFMANFWTGQYFLDDISGYKHIAADANVYPFFMEVINNRTLMKKAMASIRKDKLHKPFPLKYTKVPAPQKRIWASPLAPNYAGNTIWTFQAGPFLHVLKKTNQQWFKESYADMTKMIARYKTFPEVLKPNGKPYKTAFYYSDEAMIWAANYAALS